MTKLIAEDLLKMKKQDLIDLVEKLYAELEKIEDNLSAISGEYDKLRAKMSGRIGFAGGMGTRNPNVK